MLLLSPKLSSTTAASAKSSLSGSLRIQGVLIARRFAQKIHLHTKREKGEMLGLDDENVSYFLCATKIVYPPLTVY